jgi:hypothetical protein
MESGEIELSYGHISDIEAFVGQIRAEIAERNLQCLKVTIQGVDDPLSFVRAGFLPEFPKREKEIPFEYGVASLTFSKIATMFLEDLLNGLSLEEIWFWYRPPLVEDPIEEDEEDELDLAKWPRWHYCTIETYRREAIETANSLPLLLYAPDQVYEKSKRPKTDMQLFRTPGAVVAHREQIHGDTINLKGDNWKVLPVTRYAVGMSRSLYYQDVSEEQTFCGTFYYQEPESRTFLAYHKILETRSKYSAVRQMEKQLGRHKLYIPGVDPYRKDKDSLMAFFSKEYIAFAEGKSGLPDDLLFTPVEAFTHFPPIKHQLLDPTLYLENAERLPQRKRYLGVALGFYAVEDILDQYMCSLAEELGYDIVLLTHMVGSHQVVSELVDVRLRKDSFDSLIYLTD